MAEDEIHVRTLTTFDTKLPADTVEWCHVEPYRNILACGTYKLNKNEPNTKFTYRQGQILLLRIANGGELELLQQVCTSAILDMKWLHVIDIVETRILLAVVDSMGYLQIHQLKDDGKRIEFITKSKVSDEKNVMALSLDWSRKSNASDSITNTDILVSDSAGQISRFTWSKTDDLTKEFTWSAHEFHAWIVAFDYCNPFIFYSGGDDNRFLCFDSRTGSHPVIENKKHTAGVTSIHDKTYSTLLATGSYDQNVRLWDKRNFARPISTICVDGGVWRLKWDPGFIRQYLLAACMHNGFKIINHDISSVVVNYKEHKGLSYGCDWSFLKQPDVSRLNIPNGDTLISTCSYEDCLLKVSVIDFWTNKYIDEKDN